MSNLALGRTYTLGSSVGAMKTEPKWAGSARSYTYVQSRAEQILDVRTTATQGE